MADWNWNPGELFKTRDKHYPLPGVPEKMPERPSGRNAEHNFYIDNSFPSQGTIKGAHEGSQSMAPNAPTTPDMPIMSPAGQMY